MMNDLRSTVEAGGFTVSDDLVVARCFVQYTYYTGADAMVAQQLVKLGIPVTVDNVDWFKRQLLLSEGLNTQTFEYYLRIANEYRKMDDQKRQHYGRDSRTQ
jgi:hypothetical protein